MLRAAMPDDPTPIIACATLNWEHAGDNTFKASARDGYYKVHPLPDGWRAIFLTGEGAEEGDGHWCIRSISDGTMAKQLCLEHHMGVLQHKACPEAGQEIIFKSGNRVRILPHPTLSVPAVCVYLDIIEQMRGLSSAQQQLLIQPLSDEHVLELKDVALRHQLFEAACQARAVERARQKAGTWSVPVKCAPPGSPQPQEKPIAVPELIAYSPDELQPFSQKVLDSMEQEGLPSLSVKSTQKIIFGYLPQLIAAARKGLASEAYIAELRARNVEQSNEKAAVEYERNRLQQTLGAERTRADQCFSILSEALSLGGHGMADEIKQKVRQAMQSLERPA